MKKLLLLLPVLVLGLMFSGCAVKQKIGLSYHAPIVNSSAKSYASVAVTVNDRRLYVITGDKPASFIGLYRAGFGIPYDVNTKNHIPLMELIQNDLSKELKALGFVNTSAGKLLVVDILAWKFDAFQNATFDYELDVKVFDASKKEIASNKVIASIIIKGTFWTGGKGGVERDMPRLYGEIIQKIVRENKKIFEALK